MTTSTAAWPLAPVVVVENAVSPEIIVVVTAVGIMTSINCVALSKSRVVVNKTEPEVVVVDAITRVEELEELEKVDVGKALETVVREEKLSSTS